MFAERIISLITRLNPWCQGREFKTITVKGNSMMPAFSHGDRISIKQNPYKTELPILGDVIVFTHPGIEQTTFLKRIVGLPGDIIEVKCKGIFVNSLALTPCDPDFENDSQLLALTWLLGDDEYYVLGDNASDSLDSRKFGSIKLGWIIGKVW